ncbi:GNAT family N-acetyltransferase [Kitasatospora sp. MMS16-BH015]|uniref:GNAT family N-acetyltransferase n=1 Tax=Kitasatospora sp. MMS16-BH015 TaxID=2018025 RepID=UPI000CF2A7DF|nr:GNAT family N-acetyltransferase [Kitasatospora sp. MMS16-BH015]
MIIQDGGAVSVRPVRPEELAAVAVLAAEHAAYERAGAPAADLAERLHGLLFGPGPARLRVLVAELDGGLVGYASCAPELSTWEGREYLHLDCLYVRAGVRGGGVGARLVEAVVAEARALGFGEVQWQTPEWNEGAVRFYERLGAVAKPKLRFSLGVTGD